MELERIKFNNNNNNKIRKTATMTMTAMERRKNHKINTHEYTDFINNKLTKIS